MKERESLVRLNYVWPQNDIHVNIVKIIIFMVCRASHDRA